MAKESVCNVEGYIDLTGCEVRNSAVVGDYGKRMVKIDILLPNGQLIPFKDHRELVVKAANKGYTSDDERNKVLIRNIQTLGKVELVSDSRRGRPALYGSFYGSTNHKVPKVTLAEALGPHLADLAS